MRKTSMLKANWYETLRFAQGDSRVKITENVRFKILHFAQNDRSLLPNHDFCAAAKFPSSESISALLLVSVTQKR
jgi:hypothetical protein